MALRTQSQIHGIDAIPWFLYHASEPYGGQGALLRLMPIRDPLTIIRLCITAILHLLLSDSSGTRSMDNLQPISTTCILADTTGPIGRSVGDSGSQSHVTSSDLSQSREFMCYHMTVCLTARRASRTSGELIVGRRNSRISDSRNTAVLDGRVASFSLCPAACRFFSFGSMTRPL